MQLVQSSVGQACPLEHDSQLMHALLPLPDGTTPALQHISHQSQESLPLCEIGVKTCCAVLQRQQGMQTFQH